MNSLLHFICRKGMKAQRKVILTSSLFSLISTLSYSQVQDSTKVNQLDEVLVSAVRVTSKTPVSFSNLDKKDIKTRNLGQDIPLLMNFMPSVVTTTDAGNGVGYTGIRVRGSDGTRINVTVNGIPYNDAESSGTYFVDVPDFASSVESLQLQRGVGTSTNGAGAFGASLNLLTDSYSLKGNGEISNSIGSFNTRKHTVKFSSGLMNDHIELAGRLSAIASDGYVDRASTDMKSYFLQGTYVGKNTLIKAIAFGGMEKTYQAWYGVDAETLQTDRTFNFAGIYTDEAGKTRFYDNQTDNYWQDNYQLHWNQKLSNEWSTNVAFHYTKGKGYYENFEGGAESADFGLISSGVESTTDLVNQKWLDNNFYGSTFSLNYKKEKLDFILGGGWNKYEGRHFGKVIWARTASPAELGDHYYDDIAYKTDGNIFAKANYQLTKKLSLYGDLQYRRVSYKSNGAQASYVDDVFKFLNPKGGLTYEVNGKNALYFSYAKANREPNRTDYENGNPRPEKLDDYELGWRYNSAKIKCNLNGYFMKYRDQLVLTGALDEVGSPIRANSGDSYRLGIELDATVQIFKILTIQPNVTLSQNKNKDFYFARDGVLQNLGNTDIAYSPDVIMGNRVTIAPFRDFQLSFLSKYVGEQFMGNIDSEGSKLKSYFTNDVNISYEYKPKSIFKSIMVSLLVNNILNEKYESNGYFYTYDDDSVPGTITTIEGAGYYPQAGTNAMVGLTLGF